MATKISLYPTWANTFFNRLSNEERSSLLEPGDYIGHHSLTKLFDETREHLGKCSACMKAGEERKEEFRQTQAELIKMDRSGALQEQEYDALRELMTANRGQINGHVAQQAREVSNQFDLSKRIENARTNVFSDVYHTALKCLITEKTVQDSKKSEQE